MKVGSEDRTKFWVMVAILSLAVVAIAWNFSGGSSPGLPPNQTNTAAAPAAPALKVPKHSRLHPKAALDPTLQLAMLQRSESEEYSGRGRDIFAPPPPPGVVIPRPVVSPVITRPPPATIIPPADSAPVAFNLKFYGFASKTGQPKKIFLSSGEDIFIGGEGDVVNRRYKIVHIAPTSVEVEDVLTNSRQSLPLIQS